MRNWVVLLMWFMRDWQPDKADETKNDKNPSASIYRLFDRFLHDGSENFIPIIADCLFPRSLLFVAALEFITSPS